MMFLIKWLIHYRRDSRQLRENFRRLRELERVGK